MTLEKTLRCIVLAGIFVLPFVVFIITTSLFFPFIAGKNFFFRIVVEIIAGSWLALALVYPRYRPRREWLLAAFAVFVIIMAVADAQGVNPFKSFWSNYERMDGWVTLAHLFAYFVVAISVMNTQKLWDYLWHTSLAVSVGVSGYGLLQLAGLVTINQGGVRLDATFGNATYLAVYMLFNIFIAALLWTRSWVRRGEGPSTSLRTSKRLAPSLLYGGVIVLDFLILFFTATRGALLGLIGGAVLSTLLTIGVVPRSRMAWRAAAAVGAIIILGIGFWAFRDAAWIQRIEPLQRLATISFSDGTTISRFMNAGMALKGFEEKPILGWGQENYAIVFDKYFDPGMYGQEPWFDRVHNIILDWLVAGGILGLLGYLSLYGFALWCLWRKDAFAPAERSILTGLLAGYFFYLLFTFDNITSYLLFATVLAYIAWRAGEARQGEVLWEASLPAKALPFIAVVAVILVWGTGWFVNADALAQNRALLSAIAPQANVSTNFANFQKATAYGSFGTQEVREQLVQLTSQLASNTNVSNEVKNEFFDLAEQQMVQQANLSPLDARFPLFLGILFDSYGDYGDAETALERAHALSPAKQSILFQLAANAQARGDDAAALNYFKQAYELDTSYRDARILFTTALIQARDDAQADILLAPYIENGQAADPRIAAAYAGRGLYAKIVAIWKAHVAAQPTDLQGYFTLGAAYYAAGDSANAIATLQAAEQRDPSIATQAEQFIAQIKNGTAKVK